MDKEMDKEMVMRLVVRYLFVVQSALDQSIPFGIK